VPSLEKLFKKCRYIEAKNIIYIEEKNEIG